MGAVETTARSIAGKSSYPRTLRMLTSTDFRQQEPASAQQSFSNSHAPTVWRTIPILEFLQKTWENMANTPKFYELADAIHGGLENIRKWYHKTNDTDVYFVCLGQCY